MKYLYKNNLIFALPIATMFLCTQAMATENIQELVNVNQLASDMESEEGALKYEYQLDDRPDPFSPFVTKIIKKKTIKDEIVVKEKELTGMQLFEPGQLTLVALMQTGNNFIAMVQDVSGRGYMLSTGMLIGRNGVITGIDGEKITILETQKTRAGRSVENNIILSLNKEGDI